MVGAGIGAIVGLIAPDNLTGVITSNIAASIYGQMLGNVYNHIDPTDNLNYCAALGAGLGGAAGNVLGKGIIGAGPKIYPSIGSVIGSNVGRSTVTYPVTGGLVAVGEGIGSGSGESAAQRRKK